MKDKNWILTFAFEVDHLNGLNLLLQGKNILLSDAISKISAIKSKALYRKELENYDFSHFKKFYKV